MILFPPCKINLGLYVTGKREDGFHDLQTIFIQLPWHDILEVTPSESFSFRSTGLEIKGDASSNLCVKAYELLVKKKNIPPVHIHLHKIIPMGAGLGGGSADGTYTLLALNELFNLQLTDEKLREFALNLGSDCPLFVSKDIQYAEGRGELLSPCQINLPSCFVHLVNIGIHVSTKEAFLHVKHVENNNLRKDAMDSTKNWPITIKNAFETAVCNLYPELTELRKKLEENGAFYVSMSGSGSTFYAFYHDKPKVLFNDENHGIIEKIIKM